MRPMKEQISALKSLISHTPTDLKQVGELLDSLDPATRLAAVRSLGKKLQVRLWEACEGCSTSLEDVVPVSSGPSVEVIHSGKNSLPVFTQFEKRFCRVPGDEHVLYGYNEGPTRSVVGPGYFVASVDSERGEVGVNYYETPPEGAPLPEGWPQVRPNERGLSRFVYAQMIDYLRKVSAHVTIGRALRKGKMTGNYFLLCRSEPSND